MVQSIDRLYRFFKSISLSDTLNLPPRLNIYIGCIYIFLKRYILDLHPQAQYIDSVYIFIFIFVSDILYSQYHNQSHSYPVFWNYTGLREPRDHPASESQSTATLLSLWLWRRGPGKQYGLGLVNSMG